MTRAEDFAYYSLLWIGRAFLFTCLVITAPLWILLLSVLVVANHEPDKGGSK